ncbi:MAG: hypothetical protein IJ033_04850 [Clostridia bacterium]|nr:hypothetical protein [Clostridia bacterium]
MRLNASVNSVLNDIMSGDGTAVLLFASDKCNKADFVSELSSRYFKSYCFSARVDDMYELCITLAQRILADDPELCLRLRQLLFCQSRYNGVKTILNVILERIASYRREVLIVFEELELLPKDFDYTYLLYLINHAPSNLKVLLSANDFLSVGLHGFEPKYPMFVEEGILSKCEDLYTYDEYISDLTDEQIALVCYCSKSTMLSANLLNELSPDGARVYEYLSRKGVYVCKREREDFGDNLYMIDSGFANYMVSLESSYAQYMGDYKDKDVKKTIFQFVARENGNYFGNLLFAYELKDVDSIESYVKKIFNCPVHIPKLPNFLRAHKELLKVKDLEFLSDYPYIRAFQLCLNVVHGKDIEETLPKLRALRAEFKDRGDMLTYHIVLAAECFVLDYLGDGQALQKILQEADEYAESNQDYEYVGMVTKMLLPNFTRFVELKAADVERLTSENVSKHFWYFKALEDIGFHYYKQGNYRKSLEVAEKIKELLPSYQIPPRLIAMGYYENTDVDAVEKKVDDALKFALENGLDKDVYMLYTAKSLVYAYRGDMDKSKEYSNLSLQNLGNEDCYEKFFTIMIRVWQHAKVGEHKYAHDLSNVYLHYARSKAPEYVQFMASALGYTLFKMGKVEEAYILAREAIQAGSNRSIGWLMSMGIATNYLLSKGELQEMQTLLTNVIKASSSYGMNMLVVDYAGDIFAPILEQAQNMGIEPKSVEEIMHAVRLRNGDKRKSAAVSLKMFGSVSITTEGKEIQWKTRKSKDLFMHYILAGSVGMDRNVILDLLWKDYLYESAINNLKTTNNIIRKTLDSYGIDYKLNYINSRYSITINNLDNEYARYKMLIDSFNKEVEIPHKVEIMDSILKIYRADLCMDINYPEFEHERTSVKQELVIAMIKLIRILAKAGEYVESKRFLNSLMLIDTDNDYNHMVYELDRFIKLTR